MVKFLLKKPVTRLFIPLMAVFMLIFAIITMASTPVKKEYKPAIDPSTSRFKDTVAGLGIIEPKSELIKLGTNISGVVTDVYVKVGDQVKKGDKLFTVDERETRAGIVQAEAELQAATAERDNIKDQYSRYSRIVDKRAISAEEKTRREYALKIAESKVKQAQAMLEVYKTNLERLTVTAPIDGEILNINIRSGEFAQAGALSQPLMVMGDTSTYHVRVEIDQTDALNVDATAMASGVLRGYKGKRVELIFVRKEPLVRPKNNLTGDSNERIDTRIQQIVYAFNNNEINSQIGQQMDVFIERK